MKADHQRAPSATAYGVPIYVTHEGTWFQCPGDIMRPAKGVVDAMRQIRLIVKGTPKASGRVSDEGPKTYRIGRDQMAREVSRKIVEGREKSDA